MPDQPADVAQPEGALALPNMRRCIGKCVRDNQMRGVGKNQIDADCRNKCRENCLKYCERPHGDRPGEFREACRRDCAAQIERVRRP